MRDIFDLELDLHPLANRELVGQLQKHVHLDKYNTMGLPSVAECYFEAHTLGDLVHFAQSASDQPWILGGGSNVLLPERIRRPVCRMKLRGVHVTECGNDIHVLAGAGESWHALVMYTVAKGWWGVENLALIPGTVGAAPIQNIGAYGVELADVLTKVYWFDWMCAEIVEKTVEECEFDYRESWFKKNRNQAGCIVAIELRLSKQPHPILSYGPLERLKEYKTLSPARVAQEVIAIRRAKLPDPAHIHNAGSFFKNPVVHAAQFQQLRKRWPDIVAFPVADSRYKLAAGWLIDKLGMRGIRRGSVGTHSRQALVIVNYGGATFDEIVAFANWIRRRVFDETGIELQPEVQVPELWPWT